VGVVCFARWEVPKSQRRGGGCSDVEARGEMVVATGARRFCGGLCRHGRWCNGLVCCGWSVEVVHAVVPVEDVGWFDPVGRQ
jgi:hypothetical protein